MFKKWCPFFFLLVHSWPHTPLHAQSFDLISLKKAVHKKNPQNINQIWSLWVFFFFFFFKSELPIPKERGGHVDSQIRFIFTVSAARILISSANYESQVSQTDYIMLLKMGLLFKKTKQTHTHCCTEENFKATDWDHKLKQEIM